MEEKEYVSCFKFYKRLPSIVTWIAAIAFFVLFIVGCVERMGIIIMAIVGGGIGCLLIYFIMKVIVSFQILVIHYLQKAQPNEVEKKVLDD